jgi:hypothetical protein
VNWDFVRREWGAVTFVVTVIVGMVVVPLALFFANQGPGPVIVPPVTTASSAASPARTSTPARSPSPSPKVSPSPTK